MRGSRPAAKKSKGAKVGSKREKLESSSISKDKCYLAADFVAARQSVQFRSYLHGLARSKAAGKIIENDLMRDRQLNAYLKSETFDPLNADEAEYCRSWGERLAADIQNKDHRDAYVVFALVDRWDDGSGPIGG